MRSSTRIPDFPIYESMINYVGAKAVPIQLREEMDFRLDVDELDGLINDRTKLIILNSPQNPDRRRADEERHRWHRARDRRSQHHGADATRSTAASSLKVSIIPSCRWTA